MSTCVVELKCYPVCECGYVFTNFEVIRDKGPGEEVKEKAFPPLPNLVSTPNFNPEYCPKCNRSIMGIQMKNFGGNGNVNFEY